MSNALRRSLRAPRRRLGGRTVAVTRAIATAGLLVTAGAGCGSSGSGQTDRTVVTSFYPLAYATQRIVGNHFVVKNLTPAGVEPHDLELSTDDADAVERAFLVVVMGRNFQPAVEKAAAARKRPAVNVLPVVLGDDPRVVGKDTLDGDIGGLDPHIWLDPTLMIKTAEAIRDALVENDGANQSAYRTNTDALTADLTKLDADYRSGLAQCARHEIVTAHEAFARLAARYGLTQQGVAGISPSQEPDPARLATIADLVKKQGITTIFTEELVPRAVAQTVARETGAKTAVLSPLEGLPKDAKVGDYLSVMRANLAALRAALGCS